MIRKFAALAIFGALAIPAMAQPVVQVTAPLPGGGVISVGNAGYYAPGYVAPVVYPQPYYYGGYWHRPAYRYGYGWNGYRGYHPFGYNHYYRHR